MAGDTLSATLADVRAIYQELAKRVRTYMPKPVPVPAKAVIY